MWNESVSAWTPEGDKLLTELVMLGLSHSQISARLKSDLGESRSRNACIGRAMRLGLAGKAPKRDRVAAQPKIRAYTTKPLRSAPSPMRPDAPADIGSEISGAGLPITVAAKTLLELERGDCRFPVGEATGEDLRYCGARAEDGQSYCKACGVIAWKPGSPRKQRSFDRGVRRYLAL